MASAGWEERHWVEMVMEGRKRADRDKLYVKFPTSRPVLIYIVLLGHREHIDDLITFVSRHQ